MNIFRYLALLALLGSVGWFVSTPDWEPGIAIITSFSAFLLLDIRMLRKKPHADSEPTRGSKTPQNEKTYQRQRGVYEELKLILGSINAQGDAQNEHIFELHRQREESHFLFEEEVCDYIRTWIENAATLQLTNKKISSKKIVEPDELEKNSEKNTEMVIYFSEQYDKLIEIFKPYLKV